MKDLYAEAGHGALRHECLYTHTILGNCSFAIRRSYFLPGTAGPLSKMSNSSSATLNSFSEGP